MEVRIRCTYAAPEKFSSFSIIFTPSNTIVFRSLEVVDAVASEDRLFLCELEW